VVAVDVSVRALGGAHRVKDISCMDSAAKPHLPCSRRKKPPRFCGSGRAGWNARPRHGKSPLPCSAVATGSPPPTLSPSFACTRRHQPRRPEQVTVAPTPGAVIHRALADIRSLGSLLVRGPAVRTSALIGYLAKFWRIRGEVQPPAAYPQARLRMAAVCKTVASASRQLLLIRRAVTPFRAAGYHESPRRCGADAVSR